PASRPGLAATDRRSPCRFQFTVRFAGKPSQARGSCSSSDKHASLPVFEKTAVIREFPEKKKSKPVLLFFHPDKISLRCRPPPCLGRCPSFTGAGEGEVSRFRSRRAKVRAFIRGV